MATRLKTIQFTFDPYVSTITDATVTNLAQTTLYIPETVLGFVSVTAEVSFQDIITATGGTITEHRVGLQLGAAGYSTITELDDIANTAENLAGVIGPFDFTSYFSTNWSGTSMTCDLQVYFDQSTGTTQGMTNVTATIYITYQYNDDPGTNATQIKTVRIPLESLTGALTTTTNSNIGSSQIPQLTSGGILPEASVNIRDYAFIIEGNSSRNNNATDFIVSCNIDGGTAFAFANCESALASDNFHRLIYRPTPPSSTASHNFQMWISTGGVTRFNHVTITLLITYEFDASTTTSILNSIILPIEIASPVGVTTSAEASKFVRRISVQESNVSLVQSAVRLNFMTTASVAGLNMSIGSQAYRAYTHIANVVCGMFSLQQRIDSGGAQGAGLTLARGFNDISVNVYATDATDQLTNVSGQIILNYTSDVPSGGIGAANHTVMKLLSPWNAQLLDRTRINNYQFTIPESDYWLTSVGFILIQWASTASMALTFDVECLSGEGKGGGYYDLYADAYQADNERSCNITWMRGRDVFFRYPQDPDPDRIDVAVARDYRLYTSTTAAAGIYMIITYHSITYTAADSITGFTGTVELALHRASTGEKIGETSRSGDGSFSFTWYDDTEELYVVANDGTNVGRSQDTLAS